MTTTSTPQQIAPGVAPAAQLPGGPGRSRRLRIGAGQQLKGGPFTYLALIVVGIGSLFPLYWTLVAASHDQQRVLDNPPPFIPGGRLFTNLEAAWEQANLGKAIVNSAIVSGSITIATLFFCTLAGYAFAKMRFRGRNILMTAVIATLTIPPQLSVVPLFMLMSDIGWNGQLESVIFPTLVGAFGVFFMRQYLIEALPYELIEAAKIDGANEFTGFLRVVVPISTPGIITTVVITFLGAWGEFVFGLALATHERMQPITIVLAEITNEFGVRWNDLMAVSTVIALPVIAAFIFLQRYIVAGLTEGATKS